VVGSPPAPWLDGAVLAGSSPESIPNRSRCISARLARSPAPRLKHRPKHTLWGINGTHVASANESLDHNM
jgi:hypothetical protein